MRNKKRRIRSQYRDATVDNRARLLAKPFEVLWNRRSIIRGDGPLVFLDKKAA